MRIKAAKEQHVGKRNRTPPVPIPEISQPPENSLSSACHFGCRFGGAVWKLFHLFPQTWPSDGKRCSDESIISQFSPNSAIYFAICGLSHFSQLSKLSPNPSWIIWIIWGALSQYHGDIYPYYPQLIYTAINIFARYLPWSIQPILLGSAELIQHKLWLYW